MAGNYVPLFAVPLIQNFINSMFFNLSSIKNAYLGNKNTKWDFLFSRLDTNSIIWYKLKEWVWLICKQKVVI